MLRLGDLDDADGLCELEGGVAALCPRDELREEARFCRNERIGVRERLELVGPGLALALGLDELWLGDRDDADGLRDLEGGVAAVCPWDELREARFCRNDRIGVRERLELDDRPTLRDELLDLDEELLDLNDGTVDRDGDRLELRIDPDRPLLDDRCDRLNDGLDRRLLAAVDLRPLRRDAVRASAPATRNASTTPQHIYRQVLA